MNEVMVDNWNTIVGPEDTVYHLGDVALGPWEDWENVLSRLNGYKILVVGNHDRIFAGNKVKYRGRFMPVYSQWFNEMYDMMQVKLGNGELVNLSHFPYDGDSHDADRYSEYRMADDGITPLIHGHTHEDKIITYSQNGTVQIHVGMDAWNFTPVSEDQVINCLQIHKDANGVI